MDYSLFHLLFYSHILEILTYYSFHLTYSILLYKRFAKNWYLLTVLIEHNYAQSRQVIGNSSLRNVYSTLYRESETETTANNVYTNTRNDIYY